jgi:hypothetical protein
VEGLASDIFVYESLEYYGKIREEKGISIISMTREVVDGLVIYTAVGKMNDRLDSASGAESIDGLTGLAKANAFKSAETQAKSRLTISISGCPRYKAPEGLAVPEPVVQALPEVNQAPAAVIEDKCDALPQPKITSILIPSVTEPQMASIHREADAISKQAAEQQAPTLGTAVAPAIAVAPAPAADQPGMFDEPEVTIVLPVAPLPPQAPAPVVDAVLTACQPVTATGVSMPVPIPPPADQPTRLQYQAFTIRCTKLVRDKLPKAGKEAANALLPYLKKLFGTKELSPETTSIMLWESTLAKLESVTPAEAFLILKRITND